VVAKWNSGISDHNAWLDMPTVCMIYQHIVLVEACYKVCPSALVCALWSPLRIG